MNSPIKNDGNQLLFNLLNSLLNPNQQIRTTAEQQLNELSVKPGYCPMMVEFALNNQLPDHVRQMASIIAKNFIKKNWEKIDEDYDIIQISDNDKNILRSILPRGLMDPTKKIRSAISMSIASIAHWDWPTLWPNLAEELVKCLSSQNSHLVEGAVECLEMFSSGDNLTSDHIPILVKTAFPALHKLFGTQTATDSIRRSVLVIVNSCISWLGVLQSNIISEQNNPKRIVENSKQLVISIVEQWFPFVFVILNQDDKATKDYTLKIYATNFVMALMKFFSKSCSAQIEKLLGIVWKSFFGSFNLYEMKVVNAKEEDLELNEDGYNTIEAYICNLVDIVHVMLEKPKYKKVIKKELKVVVSIMMGLSQITNEHINQLMDDPNEFVSNEEDEYVANNSLRISSKEIFIRLLDEFDDSLSFILSCAQDFNQKATVLFQNNQSHWWKYRECISHTLESVSEYLIEDKKFNVNDFFNNFVIIDCKSDNPFLRMKAFDCAASFAEKEKLNVQMCTFFLEQALLAINNEKESLGVKLFGAKAIYSCAPLLEDGLENFAAPIIQSLCKLLPLTKQDTIHYVLETLNEVMKLSEKVVSENYAILLTSFFKLWTSVNLDPESTNQIVESIAIVSSLEVSNQMVQSFILPQIIKYFEDEKLDSYIKETAVGLLNAIVRKFKEPLTEGNMLKNCFLSMMKLCLSTDDNSVLQESTICMCNYLMNSSEEILFNNNFFNGVSPLKIIFDFIAKFVNPSNNSLDLEEGGLKIGNLLVFLYLRYASKLEGILYQIFKNIVCKLPSSQGETFKVNLILVFARLTVDNPTNLLNLLAKISSEVQVDAISIVLKSWIENSDTFTNFGMHYNKINVLALAKLFLLNDQRVQNVSIQTFSTQDDENNNQISQRTRSKSTKIIHNVSSSEKIFEIIISEYCSFLIDHENKNTPPFQNNLNVDTSNAINPLVENEDDNNELDNQEFDDDEDFNEYDDLDDDLQSVLRDAFNEQMDEDVEDDPAYDIDPLKDFDLKTFLQGFLSTFTTQNAQLFNLLFSKLPPAVQKKFQKLTTKK